jgi:hypothetical protein
LKDPIAQEVTPEQVQISFDPKSSWGRRYAELGFKPASAVYAKSTQAMIHQPHDPMVAKASAS